MFKTKFGIEIEFTGITRKEAAETAATYLNGRVEHTGTYYDIYTVIAPDGRKWKFMSDASIDCKKRATAERFQQATNSALSL